jgi:hypothetical protein
VIVMMVLLKEAWTWAMPSVTTPLDLLLGLGSSRLGHGCLPLTSLMALRGPLRVRALVRVR